MSGSMGCPGPRAWCCATWPTPTRRSARPCPRMRRPRSSSTSSNGSAFQVGQAVSRGARVLTGGRPLPGPGYYFQPTVLVDVDHSMSVMMQESFGPVIGIMPVDTEEEAIRLMNDSPYGLTASIWTEDMARGEKLAHRTAAGTVYVNRCDYQIGR